jgi:hypothetical protein
VVSFKRRLRPAVSQSPPGFWQDNSEQFNLLGGLHV